MAQDAPLIGILLDWQDTGSFSKRPHYALRQDYFDAVSSCGGIPIGLAYDEDHMRDYLARIDGLLCPGGNFASPVAWYVNNEDTPYEASPRAEYEVKLIKTALEMGKPVLGICGGMQIMGGAFGCKFTADLHAFYQTDINHKNGTPATDFAFDVHIEQGTQLSAIIGADTMRVNAAHREAIVEFSEHVSVSARSTDSTIQAIEIPQYPFAIGVQWHPEFFIKEDKGQSGHRKIFEAFIKAAINT